MDASIRQDMDILAGYTEDGFEHINLDLNNIRIEVAEVREEHEYDIQRLDTSINNLYNAVNNFVSLFGGDDAIEVLTELTDAVKSLKWNYIGDEPEPGPDPSPGPQPDPDPSPGPQPPYPDGSEYWKELEEPEEPEPEPEPEPDPDDKDYDDHWRELDEPVEPQPTPDPEPEPEDEDDFDDNWRELDEPVGPRSSQEPEVEPETESVSNNTETFVPDDNDPYINTNWRQLRD